MAVRASRGKRRKLVVAGRPNPQTRDVLRTRADSMGQAIEWAGSIDEAARRTNGETAAALLPWPGEDGRFADPAPLVAAARAAAGGADVILDMVGGDYIPRELELLNHGGRLCFLALMGGAVAEVDFGVVQRKHLVVTGSMLRPRSVEEKGRICKAVSDYAWPLFASGALRPVTHARFPLAEAAAAHRLMESSAHIGKILLTP